MNQWISNYLTYETFKIQVSLQAKKIIEKKIKNYGAIQKHNIISATVEIYSNFITYIFR